MLKAKDILEYVRDEDIVFDLGAGEGELSALIAREKKNSMVFALDFSPMVIYELLNKRKRENANYYVVL